MQGASASEWKNAELKRGFGYSGPPASRTEREHRQKARKAEEINKEIRKGWVQSSGIYECNDSPNGQRLSAQSMKAFLQRALTPPPDQPEFADDPDQLQAEMTNEDPILPGYKSDFFYQTTSHWWILERSSSKDQVLMNSMMVRVICPRNESVENLMSQHGSHGWSCLKIARISSSWLFMILINCWLHERPNFQLEIMVCNCIEPKKFSLTYICG